MTRKSDFPPKLKPGWTFEECWERDKKFYELSDTGLPCPQSSNEAQSLAFGCALSPNPKVRAYGKWLADRMGAESVSFEPPDAAKVQPQVVLFKPSSPS